ncbi:hypothetical protein ACN47E_001323 [Coniothyrium glycines]
MVLIPLASITFFVLQPLPAAKTAANALLVRPDKSFTRIPGQIADHELSSGVKSDGARFLKWLVRTEVRVGSVGIPASATLDTTSPITNYQYDVVATLRKGGRSFIVDERYEGIDFA